MQKGGAPLERRPALMAMRMQARVLCPALLHHSTGGKRSNSHARHADDREHRGVARAGQTRTRLAGRLVARVGAGLVIGVGALVPALVATLVTALVALGG